MQPKIYNISWIICETIMFLRSNMGICTKKTIYMHYFDYMHPIHIVINFIIILITYLYIQQNKNLI